VTATVGSAQWALNHVAAFGRDLGLDVRDAGVLHHYNSTVVLLPVEDLVVRLADEVGAETLDRVRISQAVCTWLIEHHDFPATRPAPGLPPVVLADALTASFWQYHRPADPPVTITSKDLATLVRRLHQVTTAPIGLTQWSPLSSLSTALDSKRAIRVLTADDHDWLRLRVREIQDAVASTDWPLGAGLIHGDAWAGNVLAEQAQGQPTLRLGDWDNTSIGPREIDLIPTWHASYRYGKGSQWRAAFQDFYGYDLQSWPGFPLLMHMRDMVQLTGPLRRAEPGNAFASALEQRFRDIRGGTADTVWTAL
jgi:hypothetical protein